ncbi:MAG TPA: nitrous oxide reductase family maturation protein NosD [Candidatus Sulfotelmatobacter sp.]|nr:nitrous oxide reductase family maturation protein NosD [Candidatus Sulfotelmatobacter sp.]
MTSWLTGRFGPSQRRLIALAAVLLLPVFFLPVLPIWMMRLHAPQYPEGLQLTIYTNTIRGDLGKINALNHYVGMKAITPHDFREFGYMPLALTLFGLLALLAALVNRRWVALLGWLLFTGFAGYMFRDYAQWLWHYGHDLDPRAALKMPSFTPPLIGYARMANFRVLSLPAIGTWLLGLAWVIGPLVVWWDWRVSKRHAAPAARAAAVTALVGIAALGIGAGRAEAGFVVPATPGAAAAALQAAHDGDTLWLAAGVHRGPLVIRRSVTVLAQPGAVVDGGGLGTVITVAAPGVHLEHFAVRGSGSNLMNVDAGIHVAVTDHAVLRDLEVSDVLYGLNCERSTALSVDNCRFTGRVAPLDDLGNGNGIHLWYSSDVWLHRNHVERFLDAIYLSFANQVDVDQNQLERNGRYGLHSMYSQRSHLRGNLFTRNAAGCALMFSNQLEVEHNDFVFNRGPRTYGLLLRDCSDGTFLENRLGSNTIAVFMDGSNRNRFRGNLIENNGWGLLIFASCADNVFAGNQFIQNDYPVALDMRRTSNRFDEGRLGNYWSDNPAFDLDGDGVSDVPHSPVTAFAFLSKQYPDLTILAESPAVAALGVAERVLPALRPSEAVDSFPLMSARLPSGARRAGRGHGATRPAWGAAGAFALLGAGGMAGMIRPSRSRSGESESS